MSEETSQQILPALHGVGSVACSMGQSVKIKGGIVGEGIGFQIGLQVLHGIEFGGIRRQNLQVCRTRQHALLDEFALVSLEISGASLQRRRSAVSLPVGQITCTSCSFSQSLVHCPVTVRYLLDSDHHIDHHRASAWCADCNRIEDVEDIPKPATIDAELLAEEQSARATVVGRLKDKVGLPMSSERRWAHKRMMSLRLKKEWLRQRCSPPRCLSCGSTEIVNVDWENNGSGGHAEPNRQMSRTFRHPCGGRLVLTSSSGMRFNVAPRRFVVDPEGTLLRIENEDGVSDELAEFLGNTSGR